MSSEIIRRAPDIQKLCEIFYVIVQRFGKIKLKLNYCKSQNMVHMYSQRSRYSIYWSQREDNGGSNDTYCRISRELQKNALESSMISSLGRNCGILPSTSRVCLSANGPMLSKLITVLLATVNTATKTGL